MNNRSCWREFYTFLPKITTTIAAVLQMIVEKDTVMIKAAHVGQLLFHKKEKVWQRERIIVYHVYYCVIRLLYHYTMYLRIKEQVLCHRYHYTMYLRHCDIESWNLTSFSLSNFLFLRDCRIITAPSHLNHSKGTTNNYK